MSMVDNFAEQLNALRRFIQENPPGAEARGLDYLEHSEVYFPLEVRREHVSCTLYVELDSFASESFTDEAGNRWRKVTLKTQPSWPSYGSVSVNDAKLFVKLVSDVTDFAAKLLEAFPEPFVKMVETAEQIAARKQKAAEERTCHEVAALTRANHKGMKVGQQRQVDLPEGAADLLTEGAVHATVWDGPRQYTAVPTAKRTVTILRV